MPEEKKLTVLQQFIKDKPIPEDIILKCCDGEKKENALSFIVWLRENKLSPRFSRSSPNSWEADYKGKSICILSLRGAGMVQGDWRIRLNLAHMEAYSETIMNEGLQEIIWNSVGYCLYSERSPYFGMAKAPGCSPNKPCRLGETRTVLGKEIKFCCHGGAGFISPAETTLNGIKKLLELEKQARDETHSKQNRT